MVKFIEVSDQEEFDKLTQNKDSGELVIDFHATWCGPCKMLTKLLETSDIDFGTIYKVNIEDIEYPGVRNVPTLIKFNNGEFQDKMIGAGPELVKKFLGK